MAERRATVLFSNNMATSPNLNGVVALLLVLSKWKDESCRLYIHNIHFIRTGNFKKSIVQVIRAVTKIRFVEIGFFLLNFGSSLISLRSVEIFSRETEITCTKVVSG